MREKYESLSLSILRELAKARGMKNISSLRKGQLVDAMVEQDEADARSAGAAEGGTAAGAPAAPEEMAKQEAAEPSPVRTGSRAPETPIRRERSLQRTSLPRDRGTRNQEARGTGSSPAAGEETDRIQSYDRQSADRAQSFDRQGSDRPQYTASYDRQDRPQAYDRQGIDRPDRSAPYERQGADRPQAYDRQSTDRPQSYDRQGADRSQGYDRQNMDRQTDRSQGDKPPMDLAALDSGMRVSGVLEVLQDGYGFLRRDNYVSGENDIYVAPSQIRKFGLRTGDIVAGNTRIRAQQEKFSALLYVSAVNGRAPSESNQRRLFEDMTPIFPNHRIRMERSSKEVAMRIVDLISPIGRGQRGMIVSPPKAGKTTLLKDIARSILLNDPMMHIIIMLIDERPEEVTDIREAIVGERVEVLYSTFDESPEHHIKVAEMGIARAKRLVEYGENVTILLDSITRLARASNVTIQPSGRTLSGGLDPFALNMPKRFFGAARNMREGGSLTILATALVDTGSKMDDVVYEEFKGTGNMELVLDRKLSERRVFPAIDIQKSGTRREDLLLDEGEMEAVYIMRKALNSMKGDEAVENILNLFVRTTNNEELTTRIRRQKFV